MPIRGRHHGTSITCDGFPFLTQGASAPCALSRPTESWSFSSAKSLLAVQVEVLPGHDGSTESRARQGHVACSIEGRQLHHPDRNGIDKPPPTRRDQISFRRRGAPLSHPEESPHGPRIRPLQRAIRGIHPGTHGQPSLPGSHDHGPAGVALNPCVAFRGMCS